MDERPPGESGTNGDGRAGSNDGSRVGGDKPPPFFADVPDGKGGITRIRTSTREYREYKRTSGNGKQGDGEEIPVRRPRPGASPHPVTKGRTVAPPPIATDDKTAATPRRSRSRKSDAAACGAFVGAAFGAASLALTGGFGFAASKEEESEIGDALAECLDTLPTPIGDAVSKGGPWLKLGSRLGGSIMFRMARLREHQAEQQARARTPVGVPNIPRGGPADAASGVNAPDPGRASVGVKQTYDPFEVRAPEPASI